MRKYGRKKRKNNRTVDVHIREIRAIPNNNIKTLKGLGYK